MRLSTARRDADIKAGSFHVYKLDDLLLNETGAWKHEHLAFAHFDVEGGELKLLQGGKNAILRDRPVFTVEIYPHRRPRDARAIGAQASAMRVHISRPVFNILAADNWRRATRG